MKNDILVQVRVNKEVKEKAAMVFAETGLTLSSALRLMLNRIANEGKIPFDLLAPSDEDRIKYGLPPTIIDPSVWHLMPENLRSKAQEELEVLLLEGLEGESTPITPEFWIDMRARGVARHKERQAALKQKEKFPKSK